MQMRQTVKEIEAFQKINSVFLLASANKLETKNKEPYWRLDLKDASGTISAKIWSPASLEFTELNAGTFVQVLGKSDLFKEQVQLTIEKMHILNEEEIELLDIREFMSASPYPIAEMWEELMEICKKELTYAPWKKFIHDAFKDAEVKNLFCKIPAAKTIHHAYVGGLLEHSLSVTKICMGLAEHYPHLDRQVLFVGAICHDLGKIWEFSGGFANDYTDDGRLLGHMELALDYLALFLDKSKLEPDLKRHFKHLILSHHGTYEFGSSRLPQTAEAFILHYADNIDAKMAQCAVLFNDGQENKVGWSSYQKSLGRSIYNSVQTPEAQTNEEKMSPKRKKTSEEQCLSLLKV